MRAVFGLFALAGLVLGWIIGYHLMVKVLPEYLTMWYIAQVFMVLGVFGKELVD